MLKRRIYIFISSCTADFLYFANYFRFFTKYVTVGFFFRRGGRTLTHHMESNKDSELHELYRAERMGSPGKHARFPCIIYMQD